MNDAAETLNTLLNTSIFSSFLSDYGQRLYFPDEIIEQRQEAQQKATQYNATRPMATENEEPLYFDAIKEQFDACLPAKSIFTPAPVAGKPSLQKMWKKKMFLKNPTLLQAHISTPLVTAGRTHALSIIAALFINEGDTVLLPSLHEKTASFIIREQRKARIHHYPLFAQGHLNTQGLKEALSLCKQNKIILLLNFPNHIAGYSPTHEESEEIRRIITSQAQNGKKILVITDDTSFGFFYEDNICKESLFASLCRADKNILCVKIDGVNEEEMAWGFRLAFITFGSLTATDEAYTAMEQKVMGAIQSTVSSCSTPDQSIILKAMKSNEYAVQKKINMVKLALRYKELKEAVARHKDDVLLEPLPCNSGFCMSFITQQNANQLRLYLLEQYQTGTIAIQEHILCIAFSSVEKEAISPLIDCIYKAAHEIF